MKEGEKGEGREEECILQCLVGRGVAADLELQQVGA